MANYKQIWTPRVYPYEDHGTLDRPTQDVSMFYVHSNNTYTNKFTDAYTGNEVNFGRTLSGSDNKIKNLQDCWRWTSGYGQTHATCKKENYISWHLGAIPDLFSLSEIKGFEQHNLTGYVGIRFEYRWPYDNNRNYWSNSPVSINDMMLHYYNAYSKRLESFKATLLWASPSNANHYPDRFVDSDTRRSDTWKGCAYQPASDGARNRIRDLQLSMIGMSVEMKYHDRGSASHSRCMDIRNLTPLYSQKTGHNYVPLLAKPRTDTWEWSDTLQFYLLSTGTP